MLPADALTVAARLFAAVRLDEYFDRAPLRVLTPASDRAT